ncbi:hypothetical protein [Winogradskyella luteola]|uniref:Uncharacterized protein n=1 Tax=Winogradskyella luteola TaxID=2828330 RepID=A0A9X1JR63_9FLAO|nr:hypothetical protein [Winogradskyella luteola]MBV7270549.1 hypothetical protein [Winogradskyella luteola]
MKNQFKLSLLVLIISTIVYAQKSSTIEMDEIHTIYKENFTTNDNTTLVLNLKNTTAQVLESPDDNVYIEYTIKFKNVRKKIKERQLKHLIVSGKKEGNKINYSSKVRSNIGDRFYNYEELVIGRLGEKITGSDSIQKPIHRKSIDSVLQDIKLSELTRRNKIRKVLNIKPRQVERWNKNTSNIIISKMVIKIPKDIHVRATLENSNLVFMDDFYNRATMNIRNTRLRFKKIGNPMNVFDVDNGYFNAETVLNGKYDFANAKEVRIGRLSNSFINTEFTKVEIGEIGENNKIIDFNSEYFFYNWSNNFERFDLRSEYSKIHFFSPYVNHSLEVVGYNTRNLLGDDATEITMQPKSKTRNLLMSKPSKPEEDFSGHIFFDIVNGIIYSHNDAIKTINKD